MSSAGQATGGVVGAVVGFFTGGPTGAVYGAQIGMTVGTLIDPPKGPTINGPRLSDLSVQTSTYGANIPRIYGTVATHGNVFWLENNQLKETVKKKKSGGKGGGGGSTVKTYSYSATFAVGLCQGPIAGVRRIWVGHKLIYDAGSADIDGIIASNRAATGFRIYLGTEDQTADPRMQAEHGVANVPAYRGLAYIVFYDYPLADHGNSLLGAQVKVEVVNTPIVSFSSTSMTGLAPTSWNGIAVNDHALVTIRNGNTCRISRNYTAWDLFIPTLPYSGTWNAITTFKDRFYAVMNGQYAESLTGDIWTGDDMPRAVNYYALAAGKERLFAVANGSQYAAFTDGVTWVEVEMPASRSWVSAATNGSGTFVALASGVGVISVSTDSCLTWTDVALPNTASWTEVVFNGSVFFAVNGNGTGGGGLPSAVSTDGITWTASKIFPAFSFAGLAADRNGGAIFCAISGTLHWSLDNGTTWSTNSIPSENWLAAVALGNIVWATPPGAFAFRAHLGVTGVSTDLGSIVSAECLQSNLLSAGDIDVTDLTDTVRGYRVSQSGAIRGAIDPLQASWPFDAIQAGYDIVFKRRGTASVETIEASELDARSEGDSPGVQITIGREMDSQLPRLVSVKHLDVNREYDDGEQSDERLNTDAVHRRDLELPIVMTSTEAKQKAQTLLYMYWLERYDVTLRLPPTYIGLEPADVITITATDASYELRLTQVHYLPDGRLEVQAKYNAAAIYTSTATGEEGQSTGQTISLDGPSLYTLLDLPLMRNEDDMPGFPAAMCGYTTGWPGGIIFRSADDGQTWEDVQGFTGPVPIGFCSTSMGSGRTDIVDTANTLTVNLVAGSLESVSQLSMFAGANHFAYGADGRWEIISAQNCVLQGDGSYILSDFLRGRFGTEWAITTHVSGDQLIALTDGDMGFVAVETSSIGSERLYRGITAGRAIDDDANRAFTYNGVNLKPLSPVYLNGNRHPTTNDWTLTAIRRGRVSPEWRNLVDVPLGEATESYEVDIYSSAAFTTLKRTIAVTAQTVTYTSAQQVTDFGSVVATLYVKIYQVSSSVGRGFPLITSISR